MLPPDATCLATGGISRIDQVRTLRRAGYDGFVLGRILGSADSGSDVAAEALCGLIADEAAPQRIVEAIQLPAKPAGKSQEA